MKMRFDVLSDYLQWCCPVAATDAD